MRKAISARVLVMALEVLVPTSDPIRVGSGSMQTKPQATGDGKVPSGRRAQPPPRDEHVSRAAGPKPVRPARRDAE